MALGRIDIKPPVFKPTPKPPKNIGDLLQDSGIKTGNPIKPKMDDKYDGNAGSIWDKIGDELGGKKIVDAPDLSDVGDTVGDAVGNVIGGIFDAAETVADAAEAAFEKTVEKVADRVGDALNPF